MTDRVRELLDSILELQEQEILFKAMTDRVRELLDSILELEEQEILFILDGLLESLEDEYAE